MSNENDYYKIASKLQRQFSHSSQEKLLQLLNNAREPWPDNKNVQEEIKKRIMELHNKQTVQKGTLQICHWTTHSNLFL